MSIPPHQLGNRMKEDLCISAAAVFLVDKQIRPENQEGNKPHPSKSHSFTKWKHDKQIF